MAESIGLLLCGAAGCIWHISFERFNLMYEIYIKNMMNIDQVMDFNHKNSNLVRFKMISFDDYLGARCLMLNEIYPPAYLLSQQAIEKIFKCALMADNENFNPKFYNEHSLTKMLEQIETTHCVDLSSFQDYCEKLFLGFQMLRYPDTKVKSDQNHISLFSKDLRQLDELYFTIYEIMKIPEAVKYKTLGLYMCLTEKIESNDFKICAKSNFSYFLRRKNLNETALIINSKWHDDL